MAYAVYPGGAEQFFDSQTFGFVFLFFAFTPSAALLCGGARTLVGLYGSVVPFTVSL